MFRPAVIVTLDDATPPEVGVTGFVPKTSPIVPAAPELVRVTDDAKLPID